jgi:TonB-linked SusC/RagA family outer membrane protein
MVQKACNINKISRTRMKLNKIKSIISAMNKKRQINYIFRSILLVFVVSLLFGKQAMAKQTNTERLAQLKIVSQGNKTFYKGDIQTKISVNFSGISLDKALQKIAQKGHLKLTYRGDIITHKTVNLRQNNITVTQVLNQILQDVPLDYRVSKDRYLLIIPKEVHLRKIATTVSGTITDSQTDNPLIGASVMVKGTSIGSATDKKGHYSLDVPSLNDTLAISYVGYQTKKVPINGRTNINIALQPEVYSAQQLVVVAYGSEKKISTTGALDTLSTGTFHNAPRANVLQSLKGNVPGVLIESGSGRPESVGNVHIRGIGSINASRGPLYVVDGMPAQVSLSGLSSDDIKSVTVLKDAAATSIYGSRAANGVIIITTKKGKEGNTKFNLNVTQGFNKLTMVNRFKPLNTSEMIELMRESFYNAGRSEADFQKDLKFYGIDTTQNTSWLDALTRTGHYGKYHLSASGGNKKHQFYASGSFLKSQAPTKGFDYKKGNVMLSVNGQQNRVTYSAKILGYTVKSHNVPNGGSFESPIRAIYRFQPWIPIKNPDGSWNTSFNDTHNVVGELHLNRRPHTTLHGTAQGKLTYEVLKGLTLETTESISMGFDKDYTYYNRYFGHGRHYGGEGIGSASHDKTWTTTNILRYKHPFNSKNSIEAFVGYEAQRDYDESLYAEGRDFIEGLSTLTSASDPHSVSSGNSASSTDGIFLNAKYNYNDEYFLHGSIRRDGASVFGSQKRYGNFWSVGAAWNMSKTLLEDVSYISNLKIRGSYGTSGNSGIGSNAARGYYSTGYNYNDKAGYLLGSYANPYLTWEVNKPLDFGFDFGFLNNRLTGTFDWYRRITSSLLLSVPLPQIMGLSSYTDNYGAMKNTGVEFKINSKNIVTHKQGGFMWTTNFNISSNKNRITKLPSPITTGTYRREVGYNYYSYYLYAYAGVDPQTGHALWYSSKDKKSTTKDISKAVRTVEGSATPKFYGGLTNTFNYKNFGLSFMLYFKWGNKVYDVWGHDTNTDGHERFSATGKMSRYEYEQRWQHPGDHTNVPKIVYHNETHSYDQSSRFLYDGSYIRLRNLKFSYSLPKSASQTLNIDGAKIYIRANNLFTYVPDKALTMDPEVYANGELSQYAPNYKTVTVGINIDF